MRKSRITRESILEGAVEFLRSHRESEWNARSLATQLGISTQPIFSNFSGMDALKEEAKNAVTARYFEYVEKEISSGKWPVYKAFGMAYIRFAREERAWFHLLFMGKQEKGDGSGSDFGTSRAITQIKEQMQVDAETAEQIHLAMWICTHGIASLIATESLDLDEETASNILTEVYSGLEKKWKEKKS